jgi:SAM-dependent methyltransferase
VVGLTTEHNVPTRPVTLGCPIDPFFGRLQHSDPSVNRNTCLVCASPRVRPLLDLPAVPLQSTALFPSAEAGRAAPSGRLRLVGCDRCSAVSNAAFVADSVPYESSYENSQLFSPRFRAFAEQLSDHLVDRFELEGKHVVEVGCGKGEFLALLCTRGSLRGTGFDPTYDGESDALTGAATLQILPTWFDEHAGSDPADLVCCRHVLEHIADPVAFLRSIRRPMRPDTVLYLEVPNAAFTFTEAGLWDLIYQHCIYFTADALTAAVRSAGFDVLQQGSVFDGQFLAVEAIATSRPDEEREVEPVVDADATMDRLAEQAARFARVVDEWRSRLADWRAASKRVALWGAGAKGVSFLNVVSPDDGVGVVVDMNVRKQGRHLAGTGHLVEQPDVLRRYEPEVVVVANKAYEGEIAAALAALGLGPVIASL